MEIELTISEKNIILELLERDIEGYYLFSGKGAEEEIEELKMIEKKLMGKHGNTMEDFNKLVSDDKILGHITLFCDVGEGHFIKKCVPIGDNNLNLNTNILEELKDYFCYINTEKS